MSPVDRYGDEIEDGDGNVAPPSTARQKRSTATPRRGVGGARAPQWETVPAGTRQSICRGKDCELPIYWIERPRKGKPGTARIPVNCDVAGGQRPDSFSDGKGTNHFQDCVNAGDF